MILDFKTMDVTTLNNFYGGQKELSAKMFSDEQNRILFGTLVKGASIGYHKHETGSEIVYVVSGKGTVKYDGKMETILPGMCHYCPKGHEHALMNEDEEDLVFFAVVPQQ